MNKYIQCFLKFFVILALYFLPILFFSNNPEFYESLNKPQWAPPIWFFSLVWTSIYVLMSLYFSVVITKYGFTTQTKHIYLWIIINFLINASFTPIFFTNKNIYIGMVISILTFVTITYILIESYKLNKKLSVLLAPYLVWSLLIAILTVMIYLVN